MYGLLDPRSYADGQQPQAAQQPAQAPPQQGGLGGLFSAQMMPFYAGLAFGGDRDQQGQMAASGLALANQQRQEQRQFDARQQLAEREMSAMERQREVQNAFQRRQLALQQQKLGESRRRWDVEQAQANENPYLKGASQIAEIPDRLLGGPQAAGGVRQKMIRNLFDLEEEKRTLEETVAGESKLRTEINALPEVKDANSALSSYERIVSSASRKSGPGDLALIFNYMKMLDPGSIVQEREFATAQNAGGIPERIRGLYNRTLSGERLSDDLRQQFLTSASDLVGTYTQGLRRVRERYSPIAQSYGYNLDRTLPPVPGTSGANRVPMYNPETGEFE